MSFDICYNGVYAKEMGLLVTVRPDIPAPIQRYDAITVKGRDGTIRVYDGAVEDIEISVAFNFYAPETEWSARRRAAVNWLIRRTGEKYWLDYLGDYILDSNEEQIQVAESGSRYLFFTDDPTYYYRVKHVKLSDNARALRKIGSFTATFVCDGYQYVAGGLEEKTLTQVASNAYDLCKPIYKITGNGTCTLTVNNNDFVVIVGGNATIDSDSMISFKDDGTLINSNITGTYEDLWLQSGPNTLSATAGFTVTVIPRWRCQ